jgi:hypothetical protein
MIRNLFSFLTLHSFRLEEKELVTQISYSKEGMFDEKWNHILMTRGLKERKREIRGGGGEKVQNHHTLG